MTKLLKSGHQGNRAWTGYKGRGEERDSLNNGVGGNHQTTYFNGALMVCEGKGNLAPLRKKQLSQLAWAELQSKDELFNHQE